MPRGPEGRGLFPPADTTVVKALACDRPTAENRRPLSRFSVFDVCQRAWDLGLTLSYSTVWRRLHEDALRLYDALVSISGVAQFSELKRGRQAIA